MDWERMASDGNPLGITNGGLPPKGHRVSTGVDAYVLSCEQGRHCDYIRDCSDGCCSYYRCPDCDKTFRIEWA